MPKEADMKVLPTPALAVSTVLAGIGVVINRCDTGTLRWSAVE